jgi:hypothetical protein
MKEKSQIEIVATERFLSNLNNELMAKRKGEYFKNYHISHLVSEILNRVNKLVEGSGVEGEINGGLDFLYINLGDPYIKTIVFDGYDKVFLLETVADTIERQEQCEKKSWKDERRD